MRKTKIALIGCCALAIIFLGFGVAIADSTAGSLLIPPEETGPQTLTYDGTGDPITQFFTWPNFLTEIRAGTPWRLEVTGINLTGVGPSSGHEVDYTMRFQLVNVTYGTPDIWNSILINIMPNGMGGVNPCSRRWSLLPHGELSAAAASTPVS
jgi:hypothetical protein